MLQQNSPDYDMVTDGEEDVLVHASAVGNAHNADGDSSVFQLEVDPLQYFFAWPTKCFFAIVWVMLVASAPIVVNDGGRSATTTLEAMIYVLWLTGGLYQF